MHRLLRNMHMTKGPTTETFSHKPNQAKISKINQSLFQVVLYVKNFVTKDNIVYLAIPLSSTNASANDEFQNTVECGIHS